MRVYVLKTAFLFSGCFFLLMCAGGGTSPGECPLGKVKCDSECVSLQEDESNCGDCGHSCQPGQSCVNGVCTGGEGCPPDQTNCPGSGCVDLRYDPANCGRCGNSCGGAACYEGACLAECPTGMTACSGRCVDTTKDEDNCGACGRACASGEACEGGSCILICPTGFTNCSGLCVNTQTDHSNCGVCGRACRSDEVCVSGSCRAGECPSGLTNCSGSCVDTSTDEANCGGCGVTCSTGESCLDGSCQVVCPPGQTYCSGRCVDTNTDEANCGGCGVVCRPDKICTSGRCECPADQADCSGSCVDLDMDPANCGWCGHACTGSEACMDGSCTLSCPSGRTACGGYCVDTSSDRNNCGACGVVCASDESCIGGTCQSSTECVADTCSNATDVTGGGRFTGSTACAGNDYSGSCGGSAGREVVFSFTLTATQDVFMSTHGSTFDTVLYVRRGTCGTGTDSWCNDDEHGTLRSELNLVDLAAGTYFIFLDGYSTSAFGNYVLDVYMSDQSFEGDRCGDPEYLDIATATSVSGDTCPWYWFDSNPDTVGCSGATDGKDRVYYFIIGSSPATLTFSTCGGASWDTVLYARSVCNDRASSVGCSDDACSLQSEFRATYSSGVYYLWIDGYSGSQCGGYTINITR